MPSSSKKTRQPPPQVERSVLRIPVADAQDRLTERIAAGRKLIDDAPTPPPPSVIVRHRFLNQLGVQDDPPDRLAGLETIASQVEQWRDYNRTWLDTNLGGDAAEEYRTASTHDYSFGWGTDPTDNLRLLVKDVEQEISKLQSIQGRLSIWTAESGATPSKPISQASPDAPIFIVHGSDSLRAESVAHTVNRATGQKTIILRDEPNLGQTLIEKFEQHATAASYAIIVLTADDKGNRADETEPQPRGRQNVIFEMGYFYGLIGRRNVSVLIRPGVEKPSDMDGIAYITFDDGRAWKTELLRELRHAGFDIQL